MYFSLTNLPAMFQTPMNMIFADLIAEEKVAMYMDDILIYSADEATHWKTMHKVLWRLEEYNLYLKPEKCEFNCERIEYLGMIIEPGCVSMDHSKTAAIANWLEPCNLWDVQGFLSFANFYYQFIQNFLAKVCLLNDLTKKNTLWRWEKDKGAAFAILKQAFTEAPVLVLYDPKCLTEVEVDASNFATDGVLLQKGDNGLWHPIAYRFETMNAPECNYEIYDKEFIAIVRALKDWRHYLKGLPKFTVISDHKNLEYWTKAHNLTRQQACWLLWLSRFNLQITHCPGKFIGKSNALTRSVSTEVSNANDTVAAKSSAQD